MFVVTAIPAVPEPIPEPDPSFMDQGPAFEDALTTGRETPAASVSDTRYPNLQKYLQWARVVAMTQLGLMTTISCSIFLVSFIYPLSRNYSFQQGIVVILIGTAVSVLIGLAGYFIFVFSLAAIEFVHVILDIESNTRPLQYRNPES